MSAYQVIREFKIKGAPVLLGAILQLSDEVAAKLAGYVTPDQTGPQVESSTASCSITNGVCSIRYTNDLFSQDHHLDGTQIIVDDDFTYTLNIEEIKS